MAKGLLEKIGNIIIISVVVVIVILIISRLFYGPGIMDGFSFLGIGQDKAKTNVDSVLDHITLKETYPEKIVQEQGVFPSSSTDWYGIKKPAIKFGETLRLVFDEVLASEEQQFQPAIYKSVSKSGFFGGAPDVPGDWIRQVINDAGTFGKETNSNIKVTTTGMEMTISGFEKGFYYRIDFSQDFKSSIGNKINPETALVKFFVE